eukprot:g20799.t1
MVGLSTETMPFLQDDETSGSAWANGVGPDGMGCTAVVALLRGGSKPEVPTTAGAAACVEIRHFQNQRELDPVFGNPRMGPHYMPPSYLQNQVSLHESASHGLMAPKKKDAVQDELQDGPVEEEEPGPGKVVFNFSAEGVKNLPGELQTLLGFSGFCKEFRTGPSAEPSAWEFTKDSVIRLQNQENLRDPQDLYNDVVERPLVISIRDAGAENALIGSAEISLVPLLHDATEVALDLELNLVPEYYARWWKDDEADDPKKKDKKDKAATEDRDCWTILTLATEGIFALPESLCSLGVVSPDDFQAHPITYTASLLGESFGEGSLTKAPEALEGKRASEHSVSATRSTRSSRGGAAITLIESMVSVDSFIPETGASGALGRFPLEHGDEYRNL